MARSFHGGFAVEVERDRALRARTVAAIPWRLLPMALSKIINTKLVYGGLAAAPLAVAALGHEGPGRSLLIEVGVGLGLVAFTMLALQLVLAGRFRWLSQVIGLDTLLHFHRQAGLMAFVFLLGHVALLSLAGPFGYFLDPRVDAPRALALWAVLAALATIVLTTLLRRKLRIPYEVWLLLHGGLAVLVVSLGLVHTLRVGFYVSGPLKQGVWIGTSVLAIGLLVFARLIRPALLRRRPYRVAEVRAERGDSWTLTLEAQSHGGLRFEAGQFVWLSLGPTPFTIHQHPFSLASSAEKPGRLEITIKELGDYTRRIGATPPGTSAFIDGPYGSFVLDDDAKEIVMLAGGVGITPLMSMLRTLADRESEIPTLLIYGARSEAECTFIENLESLAEAPWLTLVPVFESPNEGFDGERGRVDAERLERLLPADGAGIHYYVCGPEPMMDTIETFLAARTVPLARVHSERFEIA